MIRFANAGDIPAIRELFDLCFPDDSGFNPYFFGHAFKAETTLLFMQDGMLCAMLQMLPYRLSLGNEEGEATYIYGACTHPAHRRKHLMAQLLEASFQEDKKHGRIASLLIPQEKWLFDFYKPFGYLPLFTLKRQVALRGFSPKADVRKLTDWREADCLYSRKVSDTGCFILRSEADWRAQFELFSALGEGAFGLYQKDSLTAYAFVWREPGGLFTQELLAADSHSAELLAQALLDKLGEQKITYCTVSGSELLGCCKPYHAAPVRGYINLMFN